MLVTVASFHDSIEAQIVRALLESEGIPAMLADLNLVSANWAMSVAVGGVRVQVLAENLDEARKLVAAYHAGELAYGAEHATAAACASCGSAEIARVVPASQKALAIATFAFAGVPISTTTQRVCRNCGAVAAEA